MNFVGRFRDGLICQDKSPHTVSGYCEDVSLFARWFESSTGKRFSPSSVTAVNVREYRDHLVRSRRMSVSTVKRRMMALSSFFRWAASEGLCRQNPVSGLKLPRATPRPPKSLSKTEVQRLRSAVHGSGNARDIALVELLLGSGLRVGELCSLDLSDVSLSPRRGRVTVRYGKGNKSRVVPITPQARAALGAYLDKRPRNSHESLFLGERGPLTTSGVYRVIKKYATAAGVSASPHSLRHTFARGILQKTKNIVVVRDLLGHESLDTTAIYTRPSMADLERAVENLYED